MKLAGNVLTITVDLSKDQGPSKSGKTIIIGTTGGNAAVPGKPDIKLGLNCYRTR
jgi:hypothetical protein